MVTVCHLVLLIIVEVAIVGLVTSRLVEVVVGGVKHKVRWSLSMSSGIGRRAERQCGETP